MRDAAGRSGARGGHAIVVAGGDPPLAAVRSRLPRARLVVAADSGIDHAHSLGLGVDVGIGDLDSVTDAGLDRATSEGARIERHPRDKDATDLELALRAAQRAGATRVTVVGGHGGRLDHELANLALLAAPALAAVELDAWIGTAHVVVVRDRAELSGPPGSIVSLVPMHGPASGVTTRGLRFPLHDAVLAPGSTQGISNELVGTTADVAVTDGVVLAIRPGALTHPPPTTGGR